MLLDQLKTDLITAQKQHDELTVSIVRFVLAKLTNARIEKGQELSDDEVTQEIAKEVKRHRESIAAYETAGRTELVATETHELKILQSYLPQQLSEDEIRTMIHDAVTQTNAAGKQDMGKVIAVVMGKTRGRAEGSIVSKLVSEALS